MLRGLLGVLRVLDGCGAVARAVTRSKRQLQARVLTVPTDCT